MATTAIVNMNAEVVTIAPDVDGLVQIVVDYGVVQFLMSDIAQVFATEFAKVPQDIMTFEVAVGENVYIKAVGKAKIAITKGAIV